jgi:ATP-dependent DNA ligase
MLAALAESLPPAGDFLYEPKWDGFRAIVYRSATDLYIQSRELKPLDRYFPELHAALLQQLPKGCVLDGEIIIVTDHGLDFAALQQRIHPAASRIVKLAQDTPSSYVAFDLLAGHMQGDRFRHAAVFLRWRPDKEPRDCGYDQLEVVPPYALKQVLGS